MKGQAHPPGFPTWTGRHSVEHVESLGVGWREATDTYLVGAVGYLVESGQEPYAVTPTAELQRRLKDAIVTLASRTSGDRWIGKAASCALIRVRPRIVTAERSRSRRNSSERCTSTSSSTIA